MSNMQNQVAEDLRMASINNNIKEKSVELKSLAKDLGELEPLNQELEQSSLLYNLRSVWENSQGRGIKVAVLDTGLDIHHPAFPPMMINRAVRINDGKKQVGLDFVQDENGHGTHCAGIIAARPLLRDRSTWVACEPILSEFPQRADERRPKRDKKWLKLLNPDKAPGADAETVDYEALTVKFVGVAPSCELMIYKVTKKETVDGIEKDYGHARMSDLALAIDDAVDNRADIISISIQAEQDSDQLFHSIHRALNLRKVVICSAGNHGSLQLKNIGYPGRYGGVITVAAHNRFGQPSAFTSNGGEVDMSAPGENVWSTWADASYACLSGTSMAAPWVAGLAALILGKHRCYVENKLAQETRIRNNEEMREHLLRMAAHSGFFKPDDGYGPLSPGDYFARYSQL